MHVDSNELILLYLNKFLKIQKSNCCIETKRGLESKRT